MRRAAPLVCFPKPRDGLLAELDLLDSVADGARDVSCLFWQTQQCLVVPAAFTRRPGFAAAGASSAAKGWPLHARSTGGGTTPQGPGVLNVAIAFRLPEGASFTIHDAYDRLCTPLENAFAELGLITRRRPVPGSFCDGQYNLAVRGQKLVGTAQRWRRGGAKGSRQAVLAHALILNTLDLRPAIGAVNAFHRSLAADEPVFEACHTTLRDLGVCVTPQELAVTLARHFDEATGTDQSFQTIIPDLATEAGNRGRAHAQSEAA